MIDQLKAVVASHEEAVGYALVVFHADGTFSLDAQAHEADEEALEAIADIAGILGCDDEAETLQ